MTQANDDAYFMRLAIAKAREGIQHGGSPFGACIVKDGQVVVCVHNVVYQTTDITAHAEVHALREACRKLGVIDLSGTTIYSTTEPCPMCFSAIHWAKCERIVYGASIADAETAGFSELPISNAQMKQMGNAPVEIRPHFLVEEAVPLFKEFLEKSPNRPY